jgi:hypothetical protein
VLAVPTVDDVPGVRDTAAAIAAAGPGIALHVGGRHQDLIDPPAARLGHRLAPAAHRLLAGATGPTSP